LNANTYYDFKLTIDLLFLAKGTAGIAFRVQDQFNYYAFIIDKVSGYKAIGKMTNGEFTILKKISDGGILLNDWHEVIITVTTGNIKVYMYDKEIASKATSEKTIEVTDFTYVKGGVSVFINGVNGFYFDNLNVEPITCWSAWEAKSDLTILNPNSNIFTEDFMGTLIERYISIDIEQINQREGPSIWEMVYDDTFLGSYIRQTTLVSDISARKRSSFLILKEKNFCHGLLRMQFVPEKDNGMISTIIKYSNTISPTGQMRTQYFSFDMSNETEPTFRLRYWNNGDVQVLNSISAAKIKGFRKAYITNQPNAVKVEYANGRITIYVSQNGGMFQQVFNTYNENIKCGFVGFGTSNTTARFSSFEIKPIELRLSLADIDHILNTTLTYIPMPSPEKIRIIADKIHSIRTKLTFAYTAFNYLMAQTSLLESSLGFNFSKNILDIETDITISEKIDIDIKKNIKNDVSSGSWKICVMSRSENQRKRYCESNYNNPIFQEKCQKNFCTECCESRIDPIYKNVIHVCKKTCFRATVAANNNDEYKNVCLDNPDSNSNIYGYCDLKMQSFSNIQKESCKLDMCNLCCVTMDAMKAKNYSMDSMSRCYKDCNDSKLIFLFYYFFYNFYLQFLRI